MFKNIFKKQEPPRKVIGKLSDYNRAQRYYKDDDEEEAVLIVDQILGIHGLSFPEASKVLSEWPREIDKDPYNFNLDKLPDDGLLCNINVGAEVMMRKFGVYSLIDLLKLRSLALSAIMYGNKNKDKQGHALLSIQNGLLVMQSLPELEYDLIRSIWIVASQAPLLATDPDHTLIGITMMLKVIDQDQNYADNPLVKYTVSTVFPAIERNIPHNHKSKKGLDILKELVG